MEGDTGTFIWADAQNEDFVSSGPNQCLVRASGGVGFGRAPSDYFVTDSGRELKDDACSFGTSGMPGRGMRIQGRLALKGIDCPDRAVIPGGRSLKARFSS